MKPGDRITPGPMPLWFKAAVGLTVAYVACLWTDLFFNWRWVWRWVTGTTD